jgi:hypothetical protein
MRYSARSLSDDANRLRPSQWRWVLCAALVVASATMVTLSGPASANPEPSPVPQAPLDSQFLRDESAMVAAEQRAADAGAIGTGYDQATHSIVAVMPKGVPLPIQSNGAVAVRYESSALDLSTKQRFDASLQSRSWASGASAYSYGYWVDATTGRLHVETTAPPSVSLELQRLFPGVVDIQHVPSASRLSRQNDTPPH